MIKKTWIVPSTIHDIGNICILLSFITGALFHPSFSSLPESLILPVYLLFPYNHVYIFFIIIVVMINPLPTSRLSFRGETFNNLYPYPKLCSLSTDFSVILLDLSVALATIYYILFLETLLPPLSWYYFLLVFNTVLCSPLRLLRELLSFC
jgi:hypothetical protein